MLKALRGLIGEERNKTAILANTSALIFMSMENLNWAGFYLYNGEELVLGPFQGKPACYRIALDRGVCGHAAKNNITVVVDNVHEFEGHIACDSASNSEIVVPIYKGDELIGVIDVDSFKLNNFTDKDREFLEGVRDILLETIYT